MRNQRHLSASKEQSYVKIHEYPTGESVFNSAAVKAAGTAVIFGLAERSQLWQPFLFGNLGGANETKIVVQIYFKENNMNKRGFTLLELLVVVLIIGILASIALPQYQMAVTKAKVASMLPLMRRFKDAFAEYKLQHGDYDAPDASYLGVSWPSDWIIAKKPCGDHLSCNDGYWLCSAFRGRGYVFCAHEIDTDDQFYIHMFQPDDEFCEVCRDKIMCFAEGEESNKVCKALGGKFMEDTEYSDDYDVYSL